MEKTDGKAQAPVRRDHTAEWEPAACVMCGGPVDPSLGVRTVRQEWVCEACAQRKGILVPCPGPAHEIAGSNRCPVCAPRWGWVIYTRLERREAATG